MSAYDMLVKCGYSPAEASRISGQPIPRNVPKNLAEANEAKYSGDTLMSAEDRIMSKFDTSNLYGTIHDMCGVDNGDCTTRKSVYRRYKFGDGRFTKKHFMSKGFEDNVKK